MTPERFEQIAKIYHDALEVEASGRAAFLAGACGTDTDLISEVQSLIEAGEQAGGFFSGGLDAPTVTVAVAKTATEGRRVSHYIVESLLGAGGMGQVYLARDVRLRRKVALKMLAPGFGSDPERIARFEREARAASALNHPNIVTVYDIGIANEGRFIVMEHVEGKTLRSMLSAGPLVGSLPDLGAQMARALRAAHASEITHRDIKPENIMVREDGLIKILDFGLARLSAADEGAESLVLSQTQTGKIMGTIRYMSPEQASGETPGPLSDVFSLGIVFYEMAAGRHPFPGESTLAILHSIIAADVKPPGSNETLDRLILSMLAKDPSRRPSSAEVEATLVRLQRIGTESKSDTVTYNLPAQRTAFVGRTDELETVEALVRDSSIRLLTLTGPGGTGKTRLALRVSENAKAMFSGGIYFVDLSPLADVSLVPSAVAKAIGARDIQGRDLSELIRDHLNSLPPALLIMDNFEHLLNATPWVGELLETCPTLRILATSRLALRVYGEQEYPVPSMSLPAPGSVLSVETLREYAAIDLFVQRAAAVRPDFRLSPGNAAAVVELCRQLDGLPLAIELAAARVKMLAPSSLLARIEGRLSLLTGGAKDLPVRQQTLRRTIDWSYELLTPPEKLLFARLSIFAGGCTLEAVEAVCNTREDLEIDVFEGIASLVDKNLLRQHQVEGEEPRFSMLETIREYGRECLRQSPDGKNTARAHAAYFLVLAEEDPSGMDLLQRESWMRSLEADHDNLRAAARYLVSSGNGDWAFRLAFALFWFWEHREEFAEGKALLEEVLRMPDTLERNSRRGRAAYALGIMYNRLGQNEKSNQWHQESYSIFEELDDKRGMATALIPRAENNYRMGRSSDAIQIIERSIRIWNELGDEASHDRAINNLALYLKGTGDLERAYQTLEPLPARFIERGDLLGAASAYSGLGDVAVLKKDLMMARNYYQQSLAIFEKLEDRGGAARLMADLASLAGEEGDFESSWQQYRDSLRLALQVGRRGAVARTLTGMAALSLRQGLDACAGKLAGAADAIWNKTGKGTDHPDREELRRTVQEVRRRLPAAECDRVWAAGQNMTLEQAVNYACAEDVQQT